MSEVTVGHVPVERSQASTWSHTNTLRHTNMLIGVHTCVPTNPHTHTQIGPHTHMAKHVHTHAQAYAYTCPGRLPLTLYHSSQLVEVLADLGKVLVCPKQLLQTCRPSGHRRA